MPPLTSETERRIAALFAPDQQDAVRELPRREVGNDLPFCASWDSAAMDRLHFAALKLSGVNMDALRRPIAVAKRDWRDLLMAAEYSGL